MLLSKACLGQIRGPNGTSSEIQVGYREKDYGNEKSVAHSDFQPNFDASQGATAIVTVAPIEGILDPHIHSVVCFQETSVPMLERGLLRNKKKDGVPRKRLLVFGAVEQYPMVVLKGKN